MKTTAIAILSIIVTAQSVWIAHLEISIQGTSPTIFVRSNPAPAAPAAPAAPVAIPAALLRPSTEEEQQLLPRLEEGQGDGEKDFDFPLPTEPPFGSADSKLIPQPADPVPIASAAPAKPKAKKAPVAKKPAAKPARILAKTTAKPKPKAKPKAK